MKPRVVAQVPNKLTGECSLGVELRFSSMEDFTPGSIARSVPALRQLLEARTQLANLITYMDGKSGAEELIARILKDPALLTALASAPKPPSGDDGTPSPQEAE
jgi:type VI secretion system protein ImpB